MRKLALVLLLAAVARAGDVPNELYERWKAFKVGSSVTVHSDVDSGGVKVECESTYTLVEITDEKAVVEVTGFTKLGANKLDMKPRRFEHAATKKAETSGEKEPKRKEGDEELEVAGKKLKCHWVEETTDDGATKYREKSWFSDEVPGKVVCQDVSADGATKNTTRSVVVKYEKK